MSQPDPKTTPKADPPRTGSGRSTTEFDRESPSRYQRGGQEIVSPPEPQDTLFDEEDRAESDNEVQQGMAGRESQGRFGSHDQSSHNRENLPTEGESHDDPTGEDSHPDRR
ncbi:MAG: hypothetical protein SGJ24_10710 [Chloroflexota bacterium]|nr:hypothetical protein [Chloroflexota bacterium]